MKIKSDFITNSSSTAFFFVFKGNVRTDLFRQLVKHEEKFNLSYDFYNQGVSKMDAWDLIKVLDTTLKNGVEDRYYLPEVKPVKDLIKEISDRIIEYEEYEKQRTDKNDRWYIDIIDKQRKFLNRLETFYNNQRNSSFVEITFGDNEGMVCGGVGCIMDYKGRNIDINDDEFLVEVESRH